MKAVDEFRAFYDAELRPVLKEMERRRRRVLGRGLTVVGVVLALAAGTLLATGAFRQPGPLLFIVPAVALLIGFLAWHTAGRSYVREFKRRVIGAVVRFCHPDLLYQPAAGIAKVRFRNSRIFKHHIDRYRAEDLAAGKVGATAVEFSEVHAQYKTTSQAAKGGTNTHWHTIFRGLFFVADFNKHFRGETVVLPDIAESSLGWLGQKLQELNPVRPDLVKIEDPEFEREFVVYGDDQVEARYILSTSLMRRILRFRQKVGRDVSLSFVASSVFVAVPMKRNMFEPRLFRTVLDFDAAWRYVADIQFALGIVQDLDLNTRIWSKQ